MDCTIVRYGEIALKGGNRSVFEKQLKDNLKAMLEKDGVKFNGIKKISGRIVIDSNDARAAQTAARVFGVTSSSPAVKIKNDLNEMKEKALEEFNKKKPSSFRITANRLEKASKETSQELNNLIGQFVKDKTGCKVDLKNPELDIGFDLTKEIAYMFTDRIEGFGGLPVGASGKIVCLLSGGIDSPVAAWLMLKRGCDVTLVHFLHDTHNKKPAKIQELKQKLAEYHPNIRLIYIPTREVEKEIIMKAPAGFRIILLRRFFMKTASKLCEKTNTKAISTGDNIGQVASQTIENLNVIDQASSVLTIRPLAGFNKQEIVDLAKKINTYETSIQQYTDCCNFLLPKHPETKAKKEEIEKIEKHMDATLIEKSLEKSYEG